MLTNDPLQPAQGYLELGMTEDAWEALNQLDAEFQKDSATLAMRVSIRMAEFQWKEALSLAEGLCEAFPDEPLGFIHAAYCLHELEETESARETLKCGPEALKAEAIYYYNLACYEAILGDLDPARDSLTRAIELDKRYKSEALKDPDLEVFWNELS